MPISSFCLGFCFAAIGTALRVALVGIGEGGAAGAGGMVITIYRWLIGCNTGMAFSDANSGVWRSDT